MKEKTITMKTMMQITVVLAAIAVTVSCSKNLPDGNGPSGGGTEIIDEPLEELPPLEDVDDVCEKMTDIGFMSYCYLNFDANMDGRVSMTEANAVKAIECDDAENFSGIEYFSNLETFKSSSVQTIDLRYNKKLLSVDCKGAPIAVIDLRYNTGLQEMSFEDCTNFVKVLLPSSLDYIGRSTFRNTAIVRFVCPDSVKTIEDSAFNGCKSLEFVTFPDCLSVIDSSAFAGCSSLKSVTFPDDIVMYLGEGAFRDCISLGAVTLPKSYGLDAEMFAGCNSLKSITWPKEVPNNYNSDNSIFYVVGEDAFKGCKSLESVTFPDDYQIIITSGTFAGCSSLKSVISFPHLGVPEAAFDGCVSLESITCKYGYVSFVEDYAFSGCSSLKTITFSDGLTEVGDYAFYGCSSLKTIMFSDDLTEIGTCAFYNCSLTKVVCYALDPPYLRNENGDPFDRYCKIPELYVPSSSVDAYNQSSWSLYFEQILPIE